MDVLQEHLGKMENLVHSKSRYTPKNSGFGSYMKSAFSQLTGYRYNQFRKVTGSDAIEHVPQKESLFPADHVKEKIDAGYYFFDSDIIEAGKECIKAESLNRKYNAGLDGEIDTLRRKILGRYAEMERLAKKNLYGLYLADAGSPSSHVK
ncbi:MAG: hypothetical protein V1813_02455 [Candidatus Aenigmatarchaeota archaeon]